MSYQTPPLPPGSTISCSFELQQYPKIGDAHARILYEAHSYISTEIYQSNSVQVEPKHMARLENILEDMESGFDMTKEGQLLAPCNDDFVGVTHVVEASSNLTVLVRCGKDGFLRSQETSIALPPPAETAPASLDSALDGVHSSRFHRIGPEVFARLCKDKNFYSQLNRAVDQYFFKMVACAGVQMPLAVGETKTQKNGMNKSTIARNEFLSSVSSTKTSKRGRSASWSLHILGHCSPKGFVTPEGCSVFAVLWFQTDIGIGLVSAEVPRSGEFKYKCSTTMPVPAISPCQPKMGAIVNNASGNASTSADAGLQVDMGTPNNSDPAEISTVHGKKTKLSSSPSTVVAGNHYSQVHVGVAQEAMVKSRIDYIVLLLSKMQHDPEFAKAACRLMNCSRNDQLEAKAMNQLIVELWKHP